MKKRYQIEKYTILFAIGGMAYFLLEVLVRGYSHYSMFLCGGACFLCCGLLNENVKIKISFISQMVLSFARLQTNVVCLVFHSFSAMEIPQGRSSSPSGFDLQPQDLSLKDRDFAPYIPQKHRMI